MKESTTEHITFPTSFDDLDLIPFDFPEMKGGYYTIPYMIATIRLQLDPLRRRKNRIANAKFADAENRRISTMIIERIPPCEFHDKRILSSLDFGGIDLSKTRFWEADLNGADLSSTKGLLEDQLSGANLSRAELPANVTFEELKNAQDLAKTATALFLVLMSSCCFVIFFIDGSSDKKILLNQETIQMPILNYHVSVSNFYYWSPIFLLTLFIWFNLHLLRLWEAIAVLPAFFPDGLTAPQKINNWLFDARIAIRQKFIKDDLSLLAVPQFIFSNILLYFTVPVTIMFVWLHYLPRHDYFVSVVNFSMIAVVIWFSFVFSYLSKIIVERDEVRLKAFRTTLSWREIILTLVSLCVGLVTLFVMSTLTRGAIHGIPVEYHEQIKEGVIEINGEKIDLGEDYAGLSLNYNDPRIFVPNILNRVKCNPFIEVNNEDLSQKPPNWQGKKDERIDLIKGASLMGHNLTFASMRKAFLVSANLSSSDLTKTDLRGADLRQSILKDCVLISTDFSGADLRGADFSECTLRNVDFLDADLRDSDLRGCILDGTDFTGADLRGTDFSGKGIPENFKGGDVRFSRAKVNHSTKPNPKVFTDMGAILLDTPLKSE